MMNVTARSGDGWVEIEVEMNGTINAGFRDLATPQNTVDVTMHFTAPPGVPTIDGVPAQINNGVEDQLKTVQAMLGRYPSGLPDSPRDVIPSQMRPLPSFGLPLRVDLFGGKLTGQQNVSNTVRIPKRGQFGKFPVITTPNTNFRVDDLPSMHIQATAKPKGRLKNVLGQVAQTTVSIPASTFVEEIPISDFSCAELYPDIDSKLDEIPDNMKRKAQLAKEQAQSLQNLEQRLISNAGNATTLKNIGKENLRSGNTEEVISIIQEAKSISPHQFQVASWKNSLSSAEEMMSDVELNRCKSNFNNRISDARTRISSVEEWQSVIDDKYFHFRKMELPDPTADLQDVPCAEQYSSVATHIDNLQQRLGPLGSGAKFELPPTPDDLGTINHQIQMRMELIKEQTSSGSKCRNQFMGHMEDLSTRINNMGTRTPQIPIEECASEFETVQNEVNRVERKGGIYGKGEMNVEERIEPIDPTEVDWTLNDFLSNISDARGVVRGNIPSDSPCFNHYMNRLDTLQDKLSAVDWNDDDDDEPPKPPDPPEMDCSDVSKSIRNRVASIEGATEQWTAKRQIARKEKRKKELLAEVGEVETKVQENVEDDNPCKDKLLSRLQQSRDQLHATGARPVTAIPCEERFPEVGQKVEDFEDDVIALRPPVTPEQIQEFAQRGNEIADQIQEKVPTDDPCRTDMAERVRNLTNRVDKLTSQVRIQADSSEGGQKSRDELLNKLMQSLDNLEASR
jgi:hypothetical protein